MKIREKLMSAYPAVVPRLILNSCRGLRAWRLKHQAFNITLPDHIYFVVSVRNSAHLMFISTVLREFKANSSNTYFLTIHFNGLSRTTKKRENYIPSNEKHVILIAESCLYLIKMYIIFYNFITIFHFMSTFIFMSLCRMMCTVCLQCNAK